MARPPAWRHAWLAIGCALGCERASGPLPAGFTNVVVPTPAGAGSRLPDWAPAPGGGLFLSSVVELHDEHGYDQASLRVARLAQGSFESVGTCAGGRDWFLNWADFPMLTALDESSLLATWLARSGEERYDYEVRAVLWNASDGTSRGPLRLHDHAGAGEHGFVSAVALPSGGAAAVWLDGRSAGSKDHGHGTMELRGRALTADLTLGPETLLDERVCDCCQTAALALGDGSVLVAYRDRSPDELRDITLVSWRPGAAPAAMRGAHGASAEKRWESADGWRIAGCPVNGPALASDGARVAVVWFTLGSDAEPRVRAAFGDARGERFGPAVEVASGATLGRVDAVFDVQGRLLVAWLSDGATEGSWRLSRVDPRAGVLAEEELAAVDRGRDSGFPRLARAGREVYLAYTATGGSPEVRVHRVGWYDAE
jgi:hypothetical protein